MTLMPSTAAAVYHDALSAGRRFRTLTFLVLLLILILQLSLFFASRFSPEVQEIVTGETAAVAIDDSSDPADLEGDVDPTEANNDGNLFDEAEENLEEAADETAEAIDEAGDDIEASAQRDPGLWQGAGYMTVYASVWLGLVVSVLYSLALLFLVIVMLNGRTVGVASAAKAFTRSLILILLFVPWQAVLNHPLTVAQPYHIPGVLYLWTELQANAASFEGRAEWLGWVRFVAWPVLALLLLLITYFGSGRGVKEAFGENLAREEESDDIDTTYEPVA